MYARNAREIFSDVLVDFKTSMIRLSRINVIKRNNTKTVTHVKYVSYSDVKAIA
jgi:hypothetical protein